MSKLFDRAKRIGVAHIREWLPDGRDDNGEWTALNPTRDDKTAGSFKINLQTGAWIDNATDDRGGDAVSLFAYIRGKSQSEAARCILEDYDATYFPGKSDDFEPPKSRDGWDGYRWCKRAPDPLPALDATWYEDKWGHLVERWDFFSTSSAFIFCACRFVDGAKKEDRPFSLWTNGKETKWRAKRPDVDYPLWNLPKLAARPGDAVVLCEGQKAASRGDACAELGKYVFVGWYGGAGNAHLTDWSPLRGRTVYFWPDADTPGRQAIKSLREIAQTHDIQLTVLHPPVGVSKGWDLADAIAEGRDVAKIIEQKQEQEKEKDEPSHFLDDLKMPFDIVGVSGSDIIFYPHGSNRIERYRASSLTKNALLTLADRAVWATYYAKSEGGIAWDSAINDIIRRSEKAPVFRFSRIRGGGAWLDNGDVVINTGEYLIIDGERKELHERCGTWVYEKRSRIPYRCEGKLSTESASLLLDICKHIRWQTKAAPYALAGWLMLAPWGGVLRWRPHVWIVGPRGTGKSWVLERIVMPVAVRDFGEKGDGTSTPAGVRQALASSAKPFVGDEMESDNPKFAEYIEQNLKLFRSASSGTEGGSTLMGTADGEGQQWIMQSMACFASIGAAIRHGADMDRFTVCELSPPKRGEIESRKAEFAKLEELAQAITTEWSLALHARTYGIIKEVLRAIDVVCAATAKITGSMRQGDQVGTLLAGAWMLSHDKAPIASEAHEWLQSLEIQKLSSDIEEKSDEEQCFDEILSARIEVANKDGRQKMTIGSALAFWFTDNLSPRQNGSEFPAITQESVARELLMLGIKPVWDKGVAHIHMAVGHPEIRRVLRDTGWASTYPAMLSRLPACSPGVFGPGRFAGIQKRYLIIKMEKLDDVPF